MSDPPYLTLLVSPADRLARVVREGAQRHAIDPLS